MARALFEVRVRRDADQRDRELLGSERLGQAAELAGHVGVVCVGVLDVIGAHHGEGFHGDRLARTSHLTRALRRESVASVESRDANWGRRVMATAFATVGL